MANVNIQGIETIKEQTVNAGDIVTLTFMDSNFVLLAVPNGGGNRILITLSRKCNSSCGFKEHFGSCFDEGDKVSKIKALKDCTNIQVYKNAEINIVLNKEE